MSEKAGKNIVNFMGEFLEYDAKNNSNFLRSYMRIRVLLDVTKPLKRQKKILKKKQGEIPVTSNSSMNAWVTTVIFVVCWDISKIIVKSYML